MPVVTKLSQDRTYYAVYLSYTDITLVELPIGYAKRDEKNLFGFRPEILNVSPKASRVNKKIGGFKSLRALLDSLDALLETKLTHDEIWARFRELASDLSPENLTCDGELSRTQVQRRLKALRKEWGQLETLLGREVTEEQVWADVMKSINVKV